MAAAFTFTIKNAEGYAALKRACDLTAELMDDLPWNETVIELRDELIRLAENSGLVPDKIK
jgi:hypothetical protein